MGWDAPSLGVLNPRAEGTPAADATLALPLDRAGSRAGRCSGWEGTGDAEGPSPLLLSQGAQPCPAIPSALQSASRTKGPQKSLPPPRAGTLLLPQIKAFEKGSQP